MPPLRPRSSVSRVSQALGALLGGIWSTIQFFTGWYQGDRPGSNSRRIAGRLTMVFIAGLLLEHLGYSEPFEADDVFRWFVVPWSLFFFLSTILVPIYLATLRRGWLWRMTQRILGPGTTELVFSNEFHLTPQRFIMDIFLSAAMAVLAAALVFREGGLVDPKVTCVEGACAAMPEAILYFAIVTFSTLGYGDISPPPDLRLGASLLAVFGNIHLGLLAGAVFFALQADRPTDSEALITDGEGIWQGRSDPTSLRLAKHRPEHREGGDQAEPISE